MSERNPYPERSMLAQWWELGQAVRELRAAVWALVSPPCVRVVRRLQRRR